MTRQIVLDTETTGLEPSKGHRIIEIGAIEIINRRITGNHFHQYINPERNIDEGALRVHGLNETFLQDKPVFSAIIDPFLEFIQDAELIIHNAKFDLGFLNHEIKQLKRGFSKIDAQRKVIDTLLLARKMHPGQKNSLDALCKRYSVDNTNRKLHGALLDSQLLALVYLAMTGGQGSLFGDSTQETEDTQSNTVAKTQRKKLRVLAANQEECLAHETRLQDIQKISHDQCVWLK